MTPIQDTPTRTRPLSLLIPEPLYLALKAKAREQDRPYAGIVRTALREHLERGKR